MKIKTCKKSYDEVNMLPAGKHKKPVKQSLFWRTVLKTFSAPELNKVGFTCERVGMEKLAEDTPCLYLMNHSSFIDLKIASVILYPKQFHIITTNDGFVGKEGLMRSIGCIPTKKFITDPTLVKDMHYAIHKLNSSVLLFPEASYSFDGTATPLPQSMGKLLKMLKVPVVMIRTHGAYLRDPLYNNLQLRDVKVSAQMTYLLSVEEIEQKSVRELNDLLSEQFTFDHFREQDVQGITVNEEFRADGLHRALYKCPHCLCEGKTVGAKTKLVCNACGAEYELLENGRLSSINRETAFTYVSDWYAWERECVAKELADGTYRMEIPVKIMILKDSKAVYEVGDGSLCHNEDGFVLTGCDGKLSYKQSPESSYSLYSDYFWYEIGDMICIGDLKKQYYCFPQDDSGIVAKARLATEELYKQKVRAKNDAI